MAGTIQAIPDYQGNMIPGTNNSLVFTLTDFDGNPQNATDIEVNIYNNSGTLDLEAVPEKATDGFYVYEWYIPTTQSNGNYYAHWTYTIDEITATEIQELTVGSDGTKDSTIYSGMAKDLRTILGYYIPCAMRIPVYFEQARPSRDQKTFSFTFNKWNQTPSIRMYRNKKELLVNENLSVNYFDGKVIFTNAQTDYDRLFVDYNFRWFSDEQLYAFLVNAINALNTQPPFSPVYNIAYLPTIWQDAVVKHAAADALRAMMLCLNFQEPRQVFGEDQAQSIFSQLDTLKKNYEEEWKAAFDRKKYGPYPKTMGIVVPKYTLPGGRSLTPCATSTYVIKERSDSVIYQEEILNLDQARNVLKSGNTLCVQSQDAIGNVVFAPVSYIWDSGIKNAYKLTLNNGRDIISSDEHLYFVNGSYQPLQDIKVDDEMTTEDNGEIESSKVKSISELRTKKKMLDIEVPSTGNLFVNGIKTHNSRWFRYLFSAN